MVSAFVGAGLSALSLGVVSTANSTPSGSGAKDVGVVSGVNVVVGVVVGITVVAVVAVVAVELADLVVAEGSDETATD